MNHIHLLSRRVTLFPFRAAKQALSLMLLAAGLPILAAEAAMIDAIDIQQRGGETYVYLHTNEAVEHETHVEDRHSISVILDDVSMFGGQLPIRYEHAPGIKHVMLEHTGPKQIKLNLEGKLLKTPIIGFRESSVVPVQGSSNEAPAVASSFLAVASPAVNASKAMAPEGSALNAAIPVLPTALESSVMQGTMRKSDAASNLTYTDAVLQEVAESYVAMLQWAKANRFLLTMILLAGVGTLFVLNFVSKLVFANPQLDADAQQRASLRMQGLSFAPKPSTVAAGVSHPAAPQPSSVNEHRLNRIREKMKQQGYAVTPEAPVVETPMPSSVDVNMKVKAAIARRNSQQYQRAGGAATLPYLPTPISHQEGTNVALAQPVQATTPPLSGNGFLHAMAEYMDTSSKEHIAKAIQQSKLKY
jgi:hypothetical protein